MSISVRGSDDPAGHHSGNSRNGPRPKTVLTDIGPIELEVPRDRAGTFEPVIVPKRRRRLGGVDHLVCSLSARGLTDGEICAHLAEVYGARVSKETITQITDRVMEGWRRGRADPWTGVPGHLRGRHRGEDPRGPGRQPPDLLCVLKREWWRCRRLPA